MLGHQKHPYVVRILKKSHPRLYSHSILHGNKRSVWSISVAAVYRVSIKQVLTLKSCGILVEGFTRQARLKASTDAFQLAFVAYYSKCDCTYWHVHETRCSRMCCDQQAFWRASANGHRCPRESEVKRRSI